MATAEQSVSPIFRFVFLVLRVLFWVAIACIPLATDRAVTDFMTSRCMPGSECLKQAMPLIVSVGLINWGAYALLWPLSAWFLGGRWLLSRFRNRFVR
jgi:hypothetical protein